MPVTKFTITGNAAQVAGSAQTITVTADDVGYIGDHTLIFSGAASSPSIGFPTTLDKSSVAKVFGVSCVLTFVLGVATTSMELTKAETVDIACTDGTISAAGADRLHVVVSAGTSSYQNMPIILDYPQALSYQNSGAAPNNLALYPRRIFWDNPGAATHDVRIEDGNGKVLFQATAKAQYDSQYARLNHDNQGGVKWRDFIVTQLDSGRLYIWYTN